jgi:hypothetical protein
MSSGIGRVIALLPGFPPSALSFAVALGIASRPVKVGVYLPVNSGSRFSANAVMPSMGSCERNIRSTNSGSQG